MLVVAAIATWVGPSVRAGEPTRIFSLYWDGAAWASPRIIPGQFGSRATTPYAILTQGNHAMKLPPEDLCSRSRTDASPPSTGFAWFVRSPVLCVAAIVCSKTTAFTACSCRATMWGTLCFTRIPGLMARGALIVGGGGGGRPADGAKNPATSELQRGIARDSDADDGNGRLQ
jgi:hypothetical protein